MLAIHYKLKYVFQLISGWWKRTSILIHHNRLISRIIMAWWDYKGHTFQTYFFLQLQGAKISVCLTGVGNYQCHTACMHRQWKCMAFLCSISRMFVSVSLHPWRSSAGSTLISWRTWGFPRGSRSSSSILDVKVSHDLITGHGGI